MATDLLLDARGVRKEFGGLVAVNDVDFSIPRGSVASLIGPNGAGKTTFFNMLTGVYKPTAGEVIFDGEDIAGQPPHVATERGIGADVPEHPPVRTDDRARERARRDALPLERSHLQQHHSHPARAADEREARQRASEILAYCNLAGKDDEYARSLSYGDQRRLEVARALGTQPKLLLLDEPTAGMNPQETASSLPSSRASAPTRGSPCSSSSTT